MSVRISQLNYLGFGGRNDVHGPGAFGFAAAAEIVRMITAPSTAPEATANKAASG